MWTTAEIGGKRVEVFSPAGEVRAAVLYLHDVDGRVPSGLGDLLAHDRLTGVCPHGESCWWADRVCPEFDPSRSVERWLIEDLLPFIKVRWPHVAVIGAGMGGQGALRLAFKHPDRFRIVAAIDAAIDHHELYGSGTALDEMYASREHCRQDTAILHIHPVRQPAHLWFACDPASRWFRGNDRLHEKLAALGVAHTFLPRAAGLDEMLAFVAAALAKEQRSLL
jgi:pimeloyl-ACP methyl ester carboxylesterase